MRGYKLVLMQLEFLQTLTWQIGNFTPKSSVAKGKKTNKIKTKMECNKII